MIRNFYLLLYFFNKLDGINYKHDNTDRGSIKSIKVRLFDAHCLVALKAVLKILLMHSIVRKIIEHQLNQTGRRLFKGKYFTLHSWTLCMLQPRRCT